MLTQLAVYYHASWVHWADFSQREVTFERCLTKLELRNDREAKHENFLGKSK